MSASPPAWVTPYIRTSYKDLDCWELCRLVLREQCGTNLPDFRKEWGNTNEVPWTDKVQEDVYAVVQREMKSWPKVTGDPLPFDIALFHIRGTIWHVATVAGGGWLLNTNEKQGAHCIKLEELGWEMMLEGYYRYDDRARTAK